MSDQTPAEQTYEEIMWWVHQEYGRPADIEAIKKLLRRYGHQKYSQGYADRLKEE